jgi:hypothetical protein
VSESFAFSSSNFFSSASRSKSFSSSTFSFGGCLSKSFAYFWSHKLFIILFSVSIFRNFIMKFCLILFTLFLTTHGKLNKSSELNKCSSNCLICESGKCTKCLRGFYAFKNACFESCPFSTFADNYTFSCVQKEQNPFFTRAYTFSRCMNTCGKAFHDCRFVKIIN